MSDWVGLLECIFQSTFNLIQIFEIILHNYTIRMPNQTHETHKYLRNPLKSDHLQFSWSSQNEFQLYCKKQF